MDRKELIRQLMAEFSERTNEAKLAIFFETLLRVKDLDLYTILMTEVRP